MRRGALFLLLTIFFLACSDRPEVPPDVLPPQQMGEIMADITLAEAWVENYFPQKANKPRDSAIAVEVDKVLVLHKVDQARFRKSYQFYKSNPVLFKELLDSVFHQNQMYQQRIFGNRRPDVPRAGTPPPAGQSVPVK
jgi:hypothetical protein